MTLKIKVRPLNDVGVNPLKIASTLRKRAVQTDEGKVLLEKKESGEITQVEFNDKIKEIEAKLL